MGTIVFLFTAFYEFATCLSALSIFTDGFFYLWFPCMHASQPAHVTYSNPKIQKKQILQDNKGISGVYRWTNLVNGKSYIGSGVNLSKRLSHYYSQKSMETQLKRGKSAIYSSILHYGLSNFILEILEFCEASEAISREQFFIDLLKPKYNILKIAGSSLGHKHTEETRAKMSEAQKGENHPMFGKTGKDNPRFGKTHSVEAKAKISAFQATHTQSKSVKIQVTDIKTNISTTYHSMNAAARALNILQSIITRYISRNQKKPYKGRYVFRKIDS